MAATKLFFDVDATQVDIKPILKKDFLELKMKAISSANPNRNGSWFTPESMEVSKESFRNKPILGYFENGDFVSHNGEWNEDVETGMSYWDTLGKKGERILGLIRSEDEVKIIKDQDGLSWICLTCALWTQYSYKQVKRLLKDAKRAKTDGQATKNISVEVDITDYEMLPNGIMKINAFNLVGITILGSRNGVKVEPGIENAELSVVDIMGRDLYEKQAQSVRMAYERLDDSEKKTKEEFQMNEQETVVETVVEEVPAEVHAEGTFNPTEETVIENVENSESVVEAFESEEPKEPVVEVTEEAAPAEETVESEHFEEVCPDCGKNPCECEAKEEPEHEEEQNVEEDHCEEHCEEEDKEDKDPEEDPEEEENKHENECCGEECCEEKRDIICDLAWLISDCHWNIESINHSIEYYQNSEEEYKEYVLSVLNRIILAQKEFQKDLGELLGKIASGISEEDRNYEAKLAQYSNVYELINNYEASLNTNKELSEKLSNYEHAEFMKQANALISSAELTEELTAKFAKECEDGLINSLEDLKVKVAVAAFDTNTKVEETIAFNAPVSKPDTVSAFNGKAEKSKKHDHWSSLREYVGKAE